MRGLIKAYLKVLGTYPNDNDKLIIAKGGSMTSGSTYFSSLDGIGYIIHVIVVIEEPFLVPQRTFQFCSEP